MKILAWQFGISGISYLAWLLIFEPVITCRVKIACHYNVSDHKLMT